MSRVLVTDGPGLVGSSVIVRLLAAGREVRSKVESPMRAAAVRAVLGPSKVQPGARESFSATKRDGDARRLDFVAGGEFLDDRIRLGE
jgi:nucleoside-diphosphate-sugar epimerase